MAAPTYKPDHILTLRVTPELRARLAAVLSKVPTGAARLSRHGLAVWCLERGLLEAEAAPRDVLTPPAVPSSSPTITPSRVAPPASPVAETPSQKQAELFALHATAAGMSVATKVGNDVTPARGRKPRPSDGLAFDLPAVFMAKADELLGAEEVDRILGGTAVAKPKAKRPPDAGIAGDPAESEALRARWRASGASQRGCAESTGLGQSTVSRWLSGEKGGSPTTLRTIAAYLDGMAGAPPSTG